MHTNELDFERSLTRRHLSRSVGLLATSLMMIPGALFIEMFSVTFALEMGRPLVWGLAPEPMFSSMAAAIAVVGLAISAGVLWDLPESGWRWALVGVTVLTAPLHLAVVAWAALNVVAVVFF